MQNAVCSEYCGRRRGPGSGSNTLESHPNATSTLSGTTALPYVFSTKSGARSVNASAVSRINSSVVALGGDPRSQVLSSVAFTYPLTVRPVEGSLAAVARLQKVNKRPPAPPRATPPLMTES
jgi:hypothetical protein